MAKIKRNAENNGKEISSKLSTDESLGPGQSDHSDDSGDEAFLQEKVASGDDQVITAENVSSTKKPAGRRSRKRKNKTPGEGEASRDGENAEEGSPDDDDIKVVFKGAHKLSRRLPQDAIELNSDLKDAKQTIRNMLEILSDGRRQKLQPRSHYLETLAESLASFYGYSRELVDLFLQMFSPDECFEFIEANESPRPVCIRSNPLKLRRRELAQLLINRGVDLEPLGDWTDLGLKITESPVPVGATPEYLAGYYMLQSASSLVPVIALAPREGERVADLCAAPGGKTTHIACLMKNAGSLVANDVNKERIKALAANLHRMGVSNCTVTNYNAKELGTHFAKFDRVLLDAPCSGLGVISRDQSIKASKTRLDVQNCARLQKELLLQAIDMLDSKSSTGGVLVYSTCSVTVEENEEVVDYALARRRVRLEPLGVAFGVPAFTRMGAKRFHPSLKLARRYYPHVHNMDGFFVAKLVKTGEEPQRGAKQAIELDETDDLAALMGRPAAHSGPAQAPAKSMRKGEERKKQEKKSGRPAPKRDTSRIRGKQHRKRGKSGGAANSLEDDALY